MFHRFKNVSVDVFNIPELLVADQRVYKHDSREKCVTFTEFQVHM